MEKLYDFDAPVDRKGTRSVKHDYLEKVFGTGDVIPMWVADMDFNVPGFLRKPLMDLAGNAIYGYTFRSGAFYEAVSEWMNKRHGWKIAPDAVEFSPGIVPAINMCVMEFTEPGDAIIVQPPVYFPFFKAATNHGRKLVNNRLREKNGIYSIDFDHLESLFRNGAKMMLFSHPHNPVGRAWTREELVRLAGLCVRYQVMMVSDEIHGDIVLKGNTHIPFASLGTDIAKQTITCVAPSKTFNLAGMYTSAVIATNPDLLKRYKQILDRVHVGGDNLFGQVALIEAYAHGEAWLGQLLEYVRNNYLYLKNRLENEIPGLGISPMEATYLAWLDFSFLGMSDGELREFIIREARLGLSDGAMFGPGGEQHQRMNLATSRKVLEEALDRLTGALGNSR